MFVCYSVNRHDTGDTRFGASTLINELFILTFLVVIESVRLVLGQKHQLVSRYDSLIIFMYGEHDLNAY